MTTSSPPMAYNINQVHEHAPWGRTTTYKLVREGRLPARKLGSSTFVLRDELEAFVRALPAAAIVGPPDR